MRAFILATIIAGTAIAAPPPVGSEDWEILSPHREWIEGLSHQGALCCHLGDGRPVIARTRGELWQVKWRPGQLSGAPTEWTDVPPEAVMRIPNPIGVPLAFWWGNAIRCFIPAGAI